jgi:hypothetical protein
MMLGTFLTFLTFLTQKLCFSAPASDPWQGLEIPPYPRGECLRPPTVGPEGEDSARGPKSASAASTSRRALMRNNDRSASGSRARALALLAEGP